MKATYFSALTNVKLSPLNGRGDQIGEGLFVTTDRDVVGRFLSQTVRDAIGGLEVNHLIKAPAVLHGHQEHDPSEFDEHKVMYRWLGLSHGFLNSLWLFKDNAATIELGFLSFERQGIAFTHSNSIAVSHYMADGSRGVVAFEREELREVRSFIRAHQGPALEAQPSSTIHAAGLDRIDRALYWAQAARTSMDLGNRIANYCTAMEALLATSTAELAHQLAERAAVVVSDSGSARMDVYRTVKRAYGMRSRIVHGDVLSATQVRPMVEISKACDGYLRAIIRRGLSDGTFGQALLGSGETVDAFFLQKLLESPGAG